MVVMVVVEDLRDTVVVVVVPGATSIDYREKYVSTEPTLKRENGRTIAGARAAALAALDRITGTFTPGAARIYNDEKLISNPLQEPRLKHSQLERVQRARPSASWFFQPPPHPTP